MVSFVENKNKFGYFTGLFTLSLFSIILISFSQTGIAEDSVENSVKLADKESHSAATEIVEQLHSNLLAVMQAADDINFTQRYAKLEPIITKSFDTPLIAKVILSRYWKDLSDQQQKDFIDLFNRQSIATYASRFNRFDHEVFQIKNIQQLKKDRLLVRSEIQSQNANTIKLDYLMHENDGNWYIISVIANGVNDLSLKRAEYSTMIKQSGFENLMTNIEKKITEMENQR